MSKVRWNDQYGIEHQLERACSLRTQAVADVNGAMDEVLRLDAVIDDLLRRASETVRNNLGL